VELDYSNPDHRSAAENIIYNHFSFIKQRGTDFGSTPEDHYNSVSTELLSNPNVIAYLGYLGDVPVSLFVGERLDDDTVGLYTPFTLRDESLVFELLNLNPNHEVPNLNGAGKVKRNQGFSALPFGALISLLKKLYLESSIKIVDEGPSEGLKLDNAKKTRGNRLNPSFWVYKPKS